MGAIPWGFESPSPHHFPDHLLGPPGVRQGSESQSLASGNLRNEAVSVPAIAPITQAPAHLQGHPARKQPLKRARSES